VRRLQFERWVRQIYATQVEEISCSECFDLVSQYVDLDLEGEAADKKIPRLKQHLDQCRVCREEYEVLRDLAHLEAEGRAPSVDDLRRSL